VQALHRYLTTDPLGYVANFGADPSEVDAATATFVDTLLSVYARKRAKRMWVEKTPENLCHLPFLIKIFPDVPYIHIRRQWEDVLASTVKPDERLLRLGSSNERQIRLLPGYHVENTPFNVILRWISWNRWVARHLNGQSVLVVNYESLVVNPQPEMERVYSFLGVAPFKVSYTINVERSDLPAWEYGSTDVRALGRIVESRVGRGSRDIDTNILAEARHVFGSMLPLQAVESNDRSTKQLNFNCGSWLSKVERLSGELALRPYINWRVGELQSLAWTEFLAGHMPCGDSVLDACRGYLSPLAWWYSLCGYNVDVLQLSEGLPPPNYDSADPRVASLRGVRTADLQERTYSLVFSLLPHASELPNYQELLFLWERTSPSGVLVIGTVASRDANEVLSNMQLPCGRLRQIAVSEFALVVVQRHSSNRHDSD
jgi:hypothetical protein